MCPLLRGKLNLGVKETYLMDYFSIGRGGVLVYSY